MSSWTDVVEQAPELAAAVAARFTAQRHHVLATVRADGAPRVSGSEVAFLDGELLIGSMVGAVKARDLVRDGRFALHAHPGDSSMAGGDAKVAGTATEITAGAELDALRTARPDDPWPQQPFRLDLTEVVLTSLAGELMRIELWRPGGPVRSWLRSAVEPAARAAT